MCSVRAPVLGLGNGRLCGVVQWLLLHHSPAVPLILVGAMPLIIVNAMALVMAARIHMEG